MQRRGGGRASQPRFALSCDLEQDYYYSLHTVQSPAGHVPASAETSMARTSGSSGPATFEAIRKAGLRLIYRYGYEAMTLRQLAGEIGLVQGSLYNHIATKQDL